MIKLNNNLQLREVNRDDWKFILDLRNRFYKDNLMNYVPVVSAIIIVHMQAEQVPRKVIDQYVDQTKFWINQLTLDMQSRGMREIIKDKQQRSIQSNRKN